MKPNFSFVVLKFGGTSVAQPDRWRVISKIARVHLESGRRPIIVCSAVAGVSNALEGLLTAALDNQHEKVLKTIELLHEPLVKAAGSAGTQTIQQGLELLTQLATGVALTGERSPRLHARVMAQGELLSTRLGALILQDEGLKPHWQDARELLTSERTSGSNGPMHYLSATCGHDPDSANAQRLRAIETDLILTQGFIAKDASGDTVLLGRGGSDTSAAYLAARLGAERCEIWTDVPGMFTANPRRLPSARMLKQLDYAEAQEIASTGAKVLHPRCLLPVRAQQIPMVIRCTTRPEIEGTIITARPTEQGQTVKAISSRSGIVLVSMETVGMWQQVGFLADAFHIFKKHNLSIDLVSTSETNVTVSLDPSGNVLDPNTLRSLIEHLQSICQPTIIDNCASVSLVGRGIRAILHRLAPALELFEEHRIHLVTQSSNDLNLTVVVDQAQADRLVQQLHRLLFKEGMSDPVLGPSWSQIFEPSHEAVVSPSSETPWWQQAREQLIELALQATPVYAYDALTLDQQASALCQLDSVDQALFAMKANPHPDVLRRLHANGLGFECVSSGELHHLRSILGTDAFAERPILYTPNFAPKEEYEVGFRLGAQVTLDNLHPLEAWPEIFQGKSVFLRVDPGTGRGHHAHVRTAGSRSKFGISLHELDRVHELARSAGAKITGLHAHSGSGIRTPENWAQLGELLSELLHQFPEVRTIDVGGGLGIPEKPGQLPLDMAALDQSLASLGLRERGIRLWIEPGRYCVATAGVLLTRVTQTKTKGDVYYVGVDAGMHSLIRPALYGAYHQIENLSRIDEPRAITANIVGPICESGDTLGHDRHLPQTREGDVLVVATAGAYGACMASQYNLRGLPIETLLVR